MNIEHKQYKKDILTEAENFHGTQYIKRFFWYSLVLIFKSEKALNRAQNDSFSILSLF